MSTMKRIDRSAKVRTGFHEAKWDEPIIYELSKPGERGVLAPRAERKVAETVGDGVSVLPASLRRKGSVNLPELSQSRVLRHYMRLSQETLGADVNIEIGQGTCTMKYSPKVNEQLARGIADLHPLQAVETVQGILEIFHETDRYLREISGMSRFTFQPGGGSQGLFAMASIVKAYMASRGETERDEFITTIYSHPSDAAAPALRGYKIIYLQPNPETGIPDLEAFKAACTHRTAGFIQANPEDTGLYNRHIAEFVKYAHEMGALCCYDQANGNAVLGVVRAKETGFDMCHFNLHKTFSTPHGCGGPACGATGVRAGLEEFLPAPLVECENGKYFFDDSFENKEYGLHKVRSFYGVAPVVFKTYCWIRSMGPNGLYQVTKTAVLNNNYLFKKMLEIPGISAYYIDGKNQRVEQCRYSMEKIYQDTGVSTTDIQRRMMDFGMHYWTSHHPFFLPEPITLEPTETPSKEDIDEYVNTLRHIFRECYDNPEYVKSAPHSSTIHQVDESVMDDPEKWATSWKVYLRKYR